MLNGNHPHTRLSGLFELTGGSACETNGHGPATPVPDNQPKEGNSMTPTRPRRGHNQNGFTLIEAMIVVAIIAIIAAVAYPTYNSQVRKSRRSDATASFITIQQAQERFRANNTAYTEDLTAISISATSPEGYYTMSITGGSASAAGYTVVATAVAGKSQANDTGCSTLTVVVSNGAATYNEPACWSK